MDLTEYRSGTAERRRTDDLLHMMPPSGQTALDVGARDGHFSVLLAERFDKVVALDLEKPAIEHPGVECVQGNAADLDFDNEAFDFVFCAEVLEHIPKPLLPQVCSELERVCKGHLLIGVPNQQDIRVGRTTCHACGGKNPPWGHVNTFDERRLIELFSKCRVEQTSLVGKTSERTNVAAVALMDLAGNPYGTYDQEEPCIHCGAALSVPPKRSLQQKICTKLAFWTRSATEAFERPRGNWLHVLFKKTKTQGALRQ